LVLAHSLTSSAVDHRQTLMTLPSWDIGCFQHLRGPAINFPLKYLCRPAGRSKAWKAQYLSWFSSKSGTSGGWFLVACSTASGGLHRLIVKGVVHSSAIYWLRRWASNPGLWNRVLSRLYCPRGFTSLASWSQLSINKTSGAEDYKLLPIQDWKDQLPLKYLHWSSGS